VKEVKEVKEVNIRPFPNKVIFGTSNLGNLFKAIPHADKLAVIAKIQTTSPKPMYDSAGKYGAGLALEELGKCLSELNVDPNNVLISNKLAWKRAPLPADGEPTFEPGAWVGLEHDATQDISYQGMMDCYAEGNALLGQYNAQIVSVHDPDEYLNAATDDADLATRRHGVLEAYRALEELKQQGKVQSIGVGAKDIAAIDWISDHVQLDWAMLACSITLYSHSENAQRVLKKLARQGVHVINSAVFNSGFLIGGSHFDYKLLTREENPEMFAWRDQFMAICTECNVKPTVACVQFSFLFEGIYSIALSTSNPGRVASNVELATAHVPDKFWARMNEAGLINLY
jgi:D-threo-aldose 1-dehydrogenase